MTLNQGIKTLLSVVVLALSAHGAFAVEKPKEEREGGIIGTGIVGTITELGSIIVNGQRVAFSKDTIARSVLGDRAATTLTPGETVVVVAQAMPQDWKADSIDVHYPAVGPIQLVGGALMVLGTPIDLSDAVDETHLLAPTLKEGDWVAVSGLWKGETLMASKLAQVDAQPNATLSGSYMPHSDDTFRIGGAVVSGLDLEHVGPGDNVTVTGIPRADGIAAQSVRIGLFSGPMETIIAQGYMSQPTQEGLYTILGSGAVSFTDQPQMIDTQTVGVFCITQIGSGEMAQITPSDAGACQ